MKFYIVTIVFLFLLISLTLSASYHAFRTESKLRNSEKSPRKRNYTKIPACANLLWSIPMPKIPTFNKKKLEQKYLSEEKADDLSNLKKYLQKENEYFNQIHEYNKIALNNERNPQKALDIKLDETDGKMLATCKYFNSYRFLTDLRTPIDCMLKTNLKQAITLQYYHFKTVIQKIVLGINKEIRESENNGLLKKENVYYKGLYYMNDKFKEGVRIKNNSFLMVRNNKCPLIKEFEEHSGIEVIFEIDTSKKQVKGLSLADCSKSRTRVIFGRLQCFKILKVEKDKEVKTCKEELKVKVTWILLRVVKCRKDKEYIDF